MPSIDRRFRTCARYGERQGYLEHIFDVQMTRGELISMIDRLRRGFYLDFFLVPYSFSPGRSNTEKDSAHPSLVAVIFGFDFLQNRFLRARVKMTGCVHFHTSMGDPISRIALSRFFPHSCPFASVALVIVRAKSFAPTHVFPRSQFFECGKAFP